MDKFCIYVLKDPDTGNPHYVGITELNWPQRLEWHLQRRLEGHLQFLSAGARRARWLLSLHERGLRPQIEALEIVTGSGAHEQERRWIQRLRRRGEDLFNGSHRPLPDDDTVSTL
jgi:hypothetical protein